MKFPFPKKASFAPSPLRASRSSSIAASISAISSRTPTSSESVRRRYARFVSASSVRPLDASHRGDSFTVRSPNAISPAGTSWNPNGIRHTANPVSMCKLMPTGTARTTPHQPPSVPDEQQKAARNTHG